jgi:1-acyl-sn-glycerol-3-phosphate acyltransferase
MTYLPDKLTTPPLGSRSGDAAATDFSHGLLPVDDGVYRTTPQRSGWIARTCPSVVFFSKFARTVWRAAALAKRGGYTGHEWSLSSLAVMRALESVGVEFEISGMRHLAAMDGPCVIAGNHMSTLETAVLPCVIQPVREVTFVVKRSLVDYPVFKHVMRSRDPVAISQTNAREDLKTMLVDGAERLARGVSIVVFPEGSRMATFAPEQFNTIGVKLAARAGTPIIPLALATDAWPVGKWISDVGKIDRTKKVRMAFGAPLQVDGRGTEQQAAIVEFIREQLNAWGVGARPS